MYLFEYMLVAAGSFDYIIDLNDCSTEFEIQVKNQCRPV